MVHYNILKVIYQYFKHQLLEEQEAIGHHFTDLGVVDFNVIFKAVKLSQSFKGTFP